MYHSTTARRNHSRRWLLLALSCALMLLGAAQLAPAALAAASDYAGGAVAGDYPIYVPNDHSVCAVRFSVTGGTLLDKNGAAVTTTGATYYVKIRMSPTTAPAGSDNRGFTWNPAGGTGGTGAWVQERDAWAGFPVATTVAGGAITGGTNWYYFKFGDTTKSGTYYLLISLQPTDGGSGTTQNSSLKPAVTVMDMAGTIAGAPSGFWVHNFAPTGLTGKRVEADAAGSTPVWALSRSVGSAPPTAAVPPDGTAGASGDFVLGAPTDNAFDVKIQTTTWPNISSSIADVDIALGATDTTPPSAPATLTVHPGDKTAALSWGAATDNTGVTGYSVYRWTDPPAGSGYTSQPVDVYDSPDGTTTTWTDTGRTNGTTYHYIVRARDAATNVGPRSSTVNAIPQAPSAVSFAASATTVAWGGGAMVGGTVSSGAGLVGESVKIQSSVGGGAWITVSTLTTGADGHFSTTVTPTQATRYCALFDTNVAYATQASAPLTVAPMVKLGVVSAPSKVKVGKSLSVSGSLTPKMSAGSKTVRIKCYLKRHGKWTLKKTFTAKNANKGSASQYKASIKLTTKGSWQLVAYSPATSKYAATTAKARTIAVK